MVGSRPSWMVHYSDGKHLNTWRVIQMPFKYWNGIWTILNKRLVRPFENQTNKRMVIGRYLKSGIRSSDVTFNPASGNRVVTVFYKTEGLSWLLSLKSKQLLEKKLGSISGVVTSEVLHIGTSIGPISSYFVNKASFASVIIFWHLIRTTSWSAEIF